MCKPGIGGVDRLFQPGISALANVVERNRLSRIGRSTLLVIFGNFFFFGFKKKI